MSQLNQNNNFDTEIENYKKQRDKEKAFSQEIDNLLNELENENVSLNVNRLDYYGNSIPLGAFCFAVSFTLIGFYESKVSEKLDKFAYSIILIFGGIGQITAGLLEYIKTRNYPTIFYLLYGLYFISYFLCNYYEEEIFQNEKNRKIFYGTWAGLAFPILIGSFQTNFIYILQNLTAFAFFIIRCIGECKNYETLNRNVSGILELVTGFLSLYLCFSQILNQHYKSIILPAFPIKKDNEIDINISDK